jgi:putative tricarboxylic transport membrane protein
MAARLQRIVPHGVMLAVSGWLYWAVTRIDAETGGRIGPEVWPKAVIVFMGLLCVYEIAKRLVVRTEFAAKGLLAGAEVPHAQEASTRVGEHREEDEDAGDNYPMLFGGIALIAGFVLAVPWIGFFTATAIFLAAFPWIGGLRRPLVSLTVSLAGTLALALVFLKVAYISLPLGEGPFRALSLALLRLLGVT